MRQLKSAYERTRVITEIADTKTKAVQSEAKHADINAIVAKAHKTGQLPVLMGRKPIETMPDVESYQDALNKVVKANQAFERLPSSIRAEFGNKPENMLHALEASEKNNSVKNRLQEIGILNKSVPPQETMPQGMVSNEPPKGGDKSSGDGLAAPVQSPSVQRGVAPAASGLNN